MRTNELGRDIVATVVTAVTVLAYATTHEQWNVWLIGDSRRWATGAVVLLGVVTFALEGVRRSIPLPLFATLGVAAVVLAGVAFWTASLTPLSLLVAAIVVLWAATTLEDVMHVPRRPVAT